MSDRVCDSSTLLLPLIEQFQQRLSAEMATQVTDFSKHFYRTATPEEIAERSLDNLYGATLSCWQFLQTVEPGKPKVHIYNPDLEQHGWRSNHTVIEIAQKDMPFLVDSVRMALNQQGLAIHTIHNAIIHTQREEGQLTQVTGMSVEGTSAESVIYVEVDRTSEAVDLKAIQILLNNVLKHVYAAVDDYEPMRNKVRDVLSELQPEGNESICNFLNWMLDDHFTFLGYDEVTVDDEQVAPVSGSALGIFKLDKKKRAKPLSALRDVEREVLLESDTLVFAKDARYSLVHRPAYMDRVIIKRLDKDGKVIGKLRFHGLYTSPVYTDSLTSIPYVRDKAQAVLKRTDFDPHSHNGKHLMQIMNDLPRDEVFLSSAEELHEIAMGIFSLNERRKARLIMRADRCDQFITFLYFVPRDIFNTELRLQVQDILMKATGASATEFTTTFSESVLARVHYVLRIDPENPPVVNIAELEADVVNISRDWGEELYAALNETCGEEQANRLLRQYRYAFTSAYREHFTPANSVYDIQRIEALGEATPITMSFYRVLEQSSELLRFKLFNAGGPLILSDVIPVLENLGMRVVGEHPYSVRRADGEQFWIHDFTLIYQGAEPVVLDEVQDVFQEAFANIWSGRAENDEFNQLVIGANLNWREVAMLRAYARYSQQIRFGFSQPYIAGALSGHIQVTRLLVALFRARFEPGRQNSEKVAALAERIESSIVDALDKVDNLNEDQILRRFLELIKATLRTSFFQRDASGDLKDYFSFKLSPKAISGIPLPRPMFEIFVYSARVEGVHLRGGKVARGGLRWSDRLEDYRTEVLGLVKAQQVKNSVIVPVGAKGGFVAKQLPTSGGRDAWLNEGIASYKIFISALLDVTDNLVAGELVPPVDVVRHDEDDPYFVVAADKGTATFSDIANEIAESRGFWLGDAFASGGSQGYDHKGMGITARGAWESVKLHFRELGLDTQTEEFTVIGIGDMAGDVFGNGMLLSEHIRLCAAFNHMHIFIDPNPNAAASFAERKRMFELPRSSWEDYDKSLISAGGGIFSRAAKWLDITPEMKERFAIEADRLTPNDLINALLKAPVDLIWNGGIGTYVKASHETHADVGDKANDGLRVNGGELRCRVLGEGGNLGFTQLGRVEFCAKGGKSNTDFIDNAGGVDCSDHEVNIKILLNEVVVNGDLTMKQRNALLREMTDAVSELVLHNNYEQAQAISLAHSHALRSMDEYVRLINRLEADGKLDRDLEFIPSSEQLLERKAKGLGLTRPELSVLISYVKMELKERLSDSWITSDAYLSKEVMKAFPQRLIEEYAEQINQHRLRKEIIATQVANGMVNTMGITFVERLMQMGGTACAEVAAAYVIARDVFDINQRWRDIEALDNQVASETQQLMMAELIRLMRRATYWFMRHQRMQQNAAAAVEKFRPAVREISSQLQKFLEGKHLELWEEQYGELVAMGAPSALADIVAAADSLYTLLGVIEASEQTGASPDQVARIHFGLSDRLNLHWFDHQVKQLETSNHWETMARDGFREDLTRHQQSITISVLMTEPEKALEMDERLALWLSENDVLLKRWNGLLQEIGNSDQQDYAIFTVAIRGLMELAQAKGKY